MNGCCLTLPCASCYRARSSVNIASRMETHGLPMHVHVGGTTAALLRGCPEFVLTPRGEIDVKGKGCVLILSSIRDMEILIVIHHVAYAWGHAVPSVAMFFCSSHQGVGAYVHMKRAASRHAQAKSLHQSNRTRQYVCFTVPAIPVVSIMFCHVCLAYIPDVCALPATRSNTAHKLPTATVSVTLT